MSRGIPSLKYLAMLSTAIIDYDEKYRDDVEKREAWNAIMELAREIHGLVVVTKKRKSKEPESEGPTSSISPDVE
jgi:hypothetical protein